MERRRFLYGFVTTVLLAPTRALAAGPALAIVCSKDSGVTSLSRAQLSAIFRLRTQQFPGGSRATPVNLSPNSAERQEFDRVVLGLEPDEMERFWIDSKIRSGTAAPRSLPSPGAVVRYVASERSAIGYVPIADVDASLRVIALVRNGSVLGS